MFPLQPNDLYETPPWATRALLRHIDVADKLVWEPAAGGHKCADELKRAGAHVHTSDIAEYGRKQDQIFDFLSEQSPPAMAYMIITNPPYGFQNRTAAQFVRLALERSASTVAMLLTAKFDSGSTRADLFQNCPRFQMKIVLTDRLKWFDGPGTQTGTEDHAWFVWGPDAYAQKTMVWEGRKPVERRQHVKSVPVMSECGRYFTRQINDLFI